AFSRRSMRATFFGSIVFFLGIVVSPSRLQTAGPLECEQALDVFAVGVRRESTAVALTVSAVQADAVAGAVVFAEEQPAAAELGDDRLQVVGVNLLRLVALPLADDEGG